jgi:hypothetical protein
VHVTDLFVLKLLLGHQGNARQTGQR